MNKREPVKILLLDHHSLTLRTLAQLINSEPDLFVCAQVKTVSQAIKKIKELEPHLTILDIFAVSQNGFLAMDQLRQQFPKMKFLLLTLQEGSTLAQSVVSWGIVYLSKKESADKIISEIFQIVQKI